MLLSRIADSLYWMSRYLERVDSTARLVEINLLHLLEAEDALRRGGRVAAAARDLRQRGSSTPRPFGSARGHAARG